MIYRAGDCGVSNSHEDSVFVWFEAISDKEAHARLLKLLALGWNEDEDRIYVGNIWSELELERNSIQANDAGPRRWFEGGSRGDWPMYFRSTELVILRNRDLRRLYDAKASAQMHARELATACAREIDALSNAPSDDRRVAERVADWRYDKINYENFANEPLGYAPARRPITVPSATDVRRLRERHLLTQAAAARLVYVTPNAWQKWEQGERKMDRRTWELLLFKLRENDL